MKLKDDVRLLSEAEQNESMDREGEQIQVESKGLLWNLLLPDASSHLHTPTHKSCLPAYAT